MNMPAAPATGTPAAPAPGAAQPAATPAAPAPAAPSGDGVITAPWANAQGVYTIGEGDQAKPWWNAIPEKEARDLMEAKQYKNPAEAALAYYNANKMLNAQGNQVVAPAADADPKEWDAFYSKLGRPEAADKYDLKPTEGVQVDDGLLKIGKEIFFDLGATPAKAQAAMDKWNSFVQESNKVVQEAQRVQNDKDLADLATKWGPDLEANKAAGMRTLNALGLPADVVDKVENQIGSAALVQLLAAIGSKTGEGKFVGTGSGTDPNDPNSMSKEQAAAKIKELQADPNFNTRYTDKNNPGHKDALALMEKLFARAG